MHTTGTREEWLAARLELLDAEKELTRRSDEVARQRQALPWVRVDKDYRFETDQGRPRLTASSRAARSCSSTTSCSGPTTRRDAHPARRSPTASTASRFTWPATTSRSARCPGPRSGNCASTGSGWAGLSRGRPRTTATSTSISGWRTRRRSGQRASSPTTSEPRIYGPPLARGSFDAFSQSIAGTDWETYRRERPGLSAFARQDGASTAYSTYERGLDALWGMYQWLDRAPLGRNEAECGGSVTTSTTVV